MSTLYNTETRQPESLDGEAFVNALASGTHTFKAGEKIRGTSPDGEAVIIPAETVRQAIDLGYSVETPTQKAVREYVDKNKGIKGAAKVALGQIADEAAFGLPELIFDKTQDPLTVAKKEALKKEHDLANTLGGVAGFGLSLATGAPLFKIGSKAGEKVAAHIAEKIVAKSGEELSKRSALQAARGFVGQMAGKTAGGAVEGAIISAPHAITEAALGDPDLAGETLLAGGVIGGLFGAGGVAFKGLLNMSKETATAAVMAGKKGVDSVDDPSRVAARKLAKVFTGVGEDDILHYTKNTDRVNQVGKTYSVEFLKDELDSSYRKFAEKVELGKANVSTLKSELDQAYNIEKQRLAQTRAPESLASDIIGEQQNLKSVLGGYSDQLYDALERADGEIKTPALKSFVTDQLNALKISPESAVIGETAKKEFARLTQLRADLDTLPKSLTFTEAKNIIKQIDPDLNFNLAAGEFNEISQRNAKSFRKFLNDQIRNPKDPYVKDEINSLLDRMSELSGVLSEVNKKFGTLEKAVSNTNNIFTPKGKLNKELLERFSQVTGKDFLTPLREYQNAKALLDKSKAIDIREELLPELTGKFRQAQAELDDALSTFEPIKRLTPSSTQNAIRNQGFVNASIETRKAIERLGDLEGKDYLTLIKDLNTYNSFYKSRPNGSRMVNMMGTLGYGTAGALAGGVVAGPVGAAAGAVLGATMDHYGGQMLKKLIDVTPNVSGLLFAEKQMKEFSKRLDAIPQTFDRMAKNFPVPPRTTSLAALIRLLDGEKAELKEGNHTESIKTRREQIKKLNDKASQWVGNPAGFQSLVTSMTHPLREGGAPGIAQALAVKSNAAFEYLFSQLPKHRKAQGMFAKQRELHPSDREISAFEQKVSVMLDPMSVFHELERGTLTKNHLGALKAVYPKLHEVFKKRVLEQAQRDGVTLPYQKRLKLSLLLGEPVAASMQPRKIADYQKTFQMLGGQDQDQSAPRARGGNINLADGVESDANQLIQ